MANVNVREILDTDEQSDVKAPFVINYTHVTGHLLARQAKGDAACRLKMKVLTKFDAGVLQIGDGTTANRFFGPVNMAAFDVGDLLYDDAMLDELAADANVVLTITGTPTVGKWKGFMEWIKFFDKAT